MKFRDLDFSGYQVFIAMEYYCLILNRTFLVAVGENELIGIKVRGLVSTRPVMRVEGNLNSRNSYINPELMDGYGPLDLNDPSVIKMNSANFRINFRDITSVSHDASTKWGMGYYPHDGKVYIETSNSKKELIILGDQEGRVIAQKINSAFKNGSNSV